MSVGRWTGLTLAGALGVLGLGIAATLPPAARPLPVRREGPATMGVPGAIHVHSNRSDGTGTPDEIAQAAARAGLKFVVLTDHGDGTRAHEPPRYVGDVLLIDAVEISTTGGHYLAVNMAPPPYRLAGEPRDVVEDVARLGGFGVAAHPGSQKPELRWRDWATPFPGLEWLNADSEWRDERPRAIARALLHYPFRAPETIASLLDRPDEVLARWDALTVRRRVVAVAAVDAHARFGRFGWRGDHEVSGPALLEIPSYDASFRTFSNRVRLEEPLTGDAGRDAAAVTRAVAEGRLYTTVDALAVPGWFEFTATSGSHSAGMGDFLPLEGRIRLTVNADLPAGARIVVLRNGEQVRQAAESPLSLELRGRPAILRVEIRIPDAPGTPPVPWLLTNPIYAGVEERPPRPPRALVPVNRRIAMSSPEVEHDPSSTADASVVRTEDATSLTMRYRLGGGARGSQYVAAVLPINAAVAEKFAGLSFLASADRPSRLSIQVRGREGNRWQRSIYLDAAPRRVGLAFAELSPAGSTTALQVRVSELETMLLVVDTVNTTPGTEGALTIQDLRYAN